MSKLAEQNVPYLSDNGSWVTNKNITIGGSANFDMSGSTGTFSLPTGTITFNGGISIASGKDIVAVGGASDYDFSLSSGITSTGTGVVTINGATTFAANKGIAYTSGTGAADFSNGSGVFKTTTGAATYGASSNTFTNAITPTGGIAAAGGFSVAARTFHTGNQPPLVSTDGTDATPVATEVYISEVFIPANVTLTGVATFNGSVASGNLKVGLANSAGAVVATSASTAMSGTDSYQRIPFTGTYAAVGPATYYVLVFIDNNTARYNAHTLGNFGAAKQTGQTYATGFTTITPPTTFTTALGAMASLY